MTKIDYDYEDRVRGTALRLLILCEPSSTCSTILTLWTKCTTSFKPSIRVFPPGIVPEQTSYIAEDRDIQLPERTSCMKLMT